MAEFNEALHPREPRGTPIGGHFAPKIGGFKPSISKAAAIERKQGGRPPLRSSMQELLERIAKPDGGFTYQPISDEEPKDGFAVSIYPERSVAFDFGKITFGDFIGYYQRNRDAFMRGGHYLGAWHDPETGKVFLDVSVIAKTPGSARALAMAHDQIAYYSLRAGKSVTVNRAAKSGGVI